jgi:hypothetical protein
MDRHGIEATTMVPRWDRDCGLTSAAAGSRDTRGRIRLLRPGTTARRLTQFRTGCVSRTQDLVKPGLGTPGSAADPPCAISRINSAAAESRHAFCCSLVKCYDGFLLLRGASIWHLRCHFCELIELNGDDLRLDPLENRKATLEMMLAKAGPGIRFNEHIEGDGETVFRHACKLGLEGVVSKQKDSSYRSGRSPNWLKMKNSDAPAVKREAEED